MPAGVWDTFDGASFMCGVVCGVILLFVVLTSWVAR